jgi:hypothetical protein
MPWRILTSLLLLLFTSASAALVSAQSPLPEADVKAAFLYNFTKFIEWPADAFAKEDSPFVVGVFGDDEFTATLAKLLDGKKAHGHSFIVRRLTQNGEAKGCQLLFFRAQEGRRLGAIYETIKQSPILIVGESDGLLDAGGMINLLFEDKQLRFEVNPAPAENARLTVSSKLLRLAKNVRKGGAK